MKLATRDIVREIDRISIEEYGIQGLILMENAGRAVAEVILDEFPKVKRVAIFAGGGNNGGDGFVVGRHLMNKGLDVNTYLTVDPKKYKGDALINFQAVPRVAVDIPSGLDSDTGFPLGVSVKADVTVTFVLPKIGLAIYPGIDYAGKVYVVDITTPRFLEKDIPFELITYDTVREILKPRHPNSHKGTYGHLFILAGSPGKTGAATLAALGGLTVGTGLVTIGIPKSLNPIMEEKTTEAMTEPLPETE